VLQHHVHGMMPGQSRTVTVQMALEFNEPTRQARTELMCDCRFKRVKPAHHGLGMCTKCYFKYLYQCTAKNKAYERECKNPQATDESKAAAKEAYEKQKNSAPTFVAGGADANV